MSETALHLAGRVLWLALPVVVSGVLHMVVVQKRWWQRLAVPLDGGRTFGGLPIFGPNKTWRGVVAMIGIGAGAGAVQGALFGHSMTDYSSLGTVALSGDSALSWAAQYGFAHAVFGLGYALGELPNSFLKRRLDINPGQTSRGWRGVLFLVVDQSDSIVACLLMGWLVFPFDGALVLACILSLTALHLLINMALHRSGVRKNL